MRTKTSLQADKILHAAAHLFGRQRFHEVRMDDIAAEAAVGKGTLYRYFSDKEELYLALVVRSSEQFLERVREEAGRAGGPTDRLEAVVAATLDFFDGQPHLLDLIQRAEVLRPTGAPFPWQQTREEMMQLVLDLFAEGEERGEFAVRDPELCATLLLGGLRSVIRFGDRPRPRGLARRIVERFLRGAAGG